MMSAARVVAVVAAATLLLLAMVTLFNTQHSSSSTTPTVDLAFDSSSTTPPPTLDLAFGLQPGSPPPPGCAFSGQFWKFMPKSQRPACCAHKSTVMDTTFRVKTGLQTPIDILTTPAKWLRITVPFFGGQVWAVNRGRLSPPFRGTGVTSFTLKTNGGVLQELQSHLPAHVKAAFPPLLTKLAQETGAAPLSQLEQLSLYMNVYDIKKGIKMPGFSFGFGAGPANPYYTLDYWVAIGPWQSTDKFFVKFKVSYTFKREGFAPRSGSGLAQEVIHRKVTNFEQAAVCGLNGLQILSGPFGKLVGLEQENRNMGALMNKANNGDVPADWSWSARL